MEPSSEAVPTTMSDPGETSHATTESVLHTSEGQEKTTVMTTESPLTPTTPRTDGAGTESPLPPSTAPQLVEILTTLPEVTGSTGRISSANYQTTLSVTEEVQTNTGAPEKKTTETIATDVFSAEIQTSPDMTTATTKEESLPPSVVTTEGADLSTQSLSVTIFHLTTGSEKLSTVTEDSTTTDAQKPAVTTASKSLTTSVDDSTTEISTTKSTTEDPCSSCNPTTEVCVDQECNCRPSKYRLTAGGHCQDTNSFVLNYRIILVDNNDAVFSKDLLNKESVAYRDIEVDIIIAISTVYGGLQNYLGSEVLEFRNGSIVVSSLVYFSRTASISNDTVGNQVVDTAALDLDRINGTLSSYTLDTGSVSVTETDECTLGLDDCSGFAECSETGEGGFSCTCLPGYHDAPGNQPAGLICISDATTESTATEIPEAPGLELWIIIVIAVGGGAALLLFLVILICVVKRCRRGKSTHPEEPFESMKVKNEKEGQDIKPTSQPGKNTEL
ncbi:uncharacterized protein [Diadema antillarum]|uniref:uncharacterized protein n=1 Tax=Diadema antillarum TaxID=105358 RepID=UPI003A855E5B